MKTRLTCLLLFSVVFTLTAQQSVMVQNGQLRARFSSRGLANDIINDGPLLTYFDESDQSDKSLILAANLWLASQGTEGNLSLHARTYGNGPVAPSSLLPKVFQVSGQAIARHRADYEDNGQINAPQEAIYGWPAFGNPFFSDYHDGLTLPDVPAAMLAPFRDADENGIYNPDAGDFPVLSEESCEDFEGLNIIPTQMNWCLYELENSDSETTYQVQANLFYFQCEENNALNNTLFLKHKVLKTMDMPDATSYWSFWADMDLGNPNDDYLGSFPEQEAVFIYNADNEDETDDLFTGFGQNPPAFGVNILAGPGQAPALPVPISSFMPYFNSNGNYPPATLDPATPQEYFNFMTGRWRDGQPLTEGGLGYTGQQIVEFAFPGLPASENTWTEYSAENTPGDRRALLNYAPINDYLPGDIRTFHTSFVYSDNQADHLTQVEGLQMRMDSIQGFFLNCYDPNGIGFQPCNLILTEVEASLSQPKKLTIYPNPTKGPLTIETEVPIERIYVLDLQGKVLFEDHYQQQIDLSHLPKGMYLLRVKAEGHLIHKKLLRQ